MKNKLLVAFSALLAQGAIAQSTCATAVPVTAGLNVVPTITGTPPTTFCNTNDTALAANWYVYTPSEIYLVTISTDLQVNSGGDTRFSVYSGDCTNLACITGDDDSGVIGNPSYLSVASFEAVPGTTYYIAFDNNWSADGFTFSLTEEEFVPPPPPIITFTQQTIQTGSQFNNGIVDMNGDYLDDIVGVSQNQVTILRQNASGGGFTTVQMTTPSTNYMPFWSLAAGDINKDGKNDLLYGNGSGVAFMTQNSNGSSFNLWQTNDYVFSQRSNFVDLNNDGNLDAFVCHDVQPNVRYLNDGNGNLTFSQGGIGDFPSGGNYGSIFVDYDNDGDQDLFIAKCRGGNSDAKVDELHRNDGNNTWTNVSVAAGMAEPSQSWSAAWGDYDNDGDMDAMIGASSFADGGHKLRKNNGDGTFTDITAGTIFETFTGVNIENTAHDFDNDGLIDILMGGNTIMKNNGNWSFTPSQIVPTSGPIGDLNNDGFLDIQNGNQIYLSNGNDNNWTKICLNGVQSNKNGIGSRIEVYTASGKQIRDVRSGDGFRYMSSLNTHVGIGTNTEIIKIVVKWPSGVVDEIWNPTINTAIVLSEGQTLSVDGAIENVVGLFPNPASDVITVQANGLEIKSFEIYDLTGRKVQKGQISNNQFNVSTLSLGTYVAILKTADGKSKTAKFVKK